jgi:hypothetical protein
MAAGPGSLGQQGREALDPPLDGDVVDLHAAFGQQLLHLAVRQPEAQLLAHRQPITSGGKQKPANADRATAAERGR